MTDKLLNHLIENAFDFLRKSIDELEKRPKYSLIHFATSVELFLKARLMYEHWSLIVLKTSDADLKKFLSGECKTVGSIEAINRLKKICNQHIPNDAAKQFEKIAAHRNRMIHFFHEAGVEEANSKLIEEVVKEQCLCWFYLDKLLEQWKDLFDQFDQQRLSVCWRMNRNRSYLSAAFEKLEPKIKKDKEIGIVFQSCSGCGYDAAEVNELSDVLYEKSCRVCKLSESYIEFDCPAECGTKIHIEADYGTSQTCSKCNCEITADDLAGILGTEYVDPVDYTPMNCALCMSLDSVVQHNEIYICTECLATSPDIAGCGWCNELQMGGGDLEHSFHSGCEFCYGHADWTKDD